MKLPRLSRPSGGDSSTTQMILSAPSSRQMALLNLRVRPPPVKPGLTQHSRNQQRLEPSGNAATNQRQQIDHGQRVCESSIWLVRNSVALREHWLWRPADGACSSGPTTRKKRDAKLMSSVAVLGVERRFSSYERW